MPHRYRRRGRSRRSYNRRRKKKYSSPYQGRLMPGFPKSKMFKFRYCDSVVLNAPIGNIASHVFKANGLYDPDVTGTGHQPLGFDEASVYYNHYVVLGSKITVAFSAGSTASSYGPSQLVGVFISDDATFPGTTSSLTEQGLTKWRYLAQAQTKGNAVTKVVNRFSAKKFFNITDIKDNIEELGATVTADPNDQAQFVVWTGSMDTGTDPPFVNCFITIDYIVLMREPKSLNQS